MGGWTHILEYFQTDLVPSMRSNTNRHLVLLIDFDDKSGRRFPEVKEKIPEDLTERVFVLGAKTTPEDLKAAIGSFETIGRKLADDCRDNTRETWGHYLLAHNETELERLRERIGPIIFHSPESAQ